MTAQAAAITAPGRDPVMLGVTYQSSIRSGAPKQKTWLLKISSSRESNVEAPLAAYPNLCRSAEIVLTPGTRKSKVGNW